MNSKEELWGQWLAKCKENANWMACQWFAWKTNEETRKQKSKKALAKTRFQIINGTYIYKHVYFIHHYLIASKMT